MYFYQSVPYRSVLFFTWEFLKITKDLKCFLPGGTQKCLVTMIANNNTDHKNKYCRYKHTLKNQLVQFIWLHLYSNSAIHSLKTNSLPEEYSEISTFLSDLAVYLASKGNHASQMIQEAFKRTIQLSYLFYV